MRGCSNFIGYLRRPELDPKDADGWFDTGDLARMDEAATSASPGARRTSSSRRREHSGRRGRGAPVQAPGGRSGGHRRLSGRTARGTRLRFVVPRDGQSFSFEAMAAYLAEQRMAKQYIPSGSRLSANSRARPAARSRSSGFAKLSATADRGSAAPTNHNNQGRTA